MANGLSFSGNGFAVAPVSNLFNNGFTAVELYICTTNSAAQTLFSYGNGEGTAQNASLTSTFTLYINDQSQVCYAEWAFIPIIDKGGLITTVFDKSTLSDGNPHQISLLVVNAVPQLFVDGQSVGVSSQSPVTPYTNSLVWTHLTSVPNSQTSTGGAFGSDVFNSAPLAPAFVGSLTELRIWTGTWTGYILNPSFSLNYGGPVNPKTSNLTYYWPFWSNPSAGLTDLVSQCSLTLGAGVTIVSDIPAFYDPLSDVVTYAPVSAFPDFTTGTQPAAFKALMTAVGGSNLTPTTFREQYTNLSNASFFTNANTDMKSCQYDAKYSCTEADFQYVKSTLSTEVQAVSYLCDYLTTAKINNFSISQQYYGAANYVYTTAMASSIANDMQYGATSPSFDTSDIFSALSAALGLASSKASDMGPEGKIFGSFLSAMSKIVSLYPSALPGPPTFDNTMAMEANYSSMVGVANDFYTSLDSGLTNSLTQIAQNGGLLSAVEAYGARFTAPALPTAAALDFINYAAILFMAKILVTTGFSMFKFTSQNDGTLKSVVAAVQEDPGTSLFYSSESLVGPTSYTIVGYFVSDGPNGYPTVFSLSSVFDTMLNDAAQQLAGQNMTQDEVFSWPYPQGTT